MAINNDKPAQWKEDIAASVDFFNAWFLEFAPKTFIAARTGATDDVKKAVTAADNLCRLTSAIIAKHPFIIPTLRMCTAPPIARDRLVGLAKTSKGLVESLEEGKLPAHMTKAELKAHLKRIAETINRMIDPGVFPWIETNKQPTDEECRRACTIVADRLCGAVADPIIRNAQEHRQLASIQKFLEQLEYSHKQHPNNKPLEQMAVGTFSFRTNAKGLSGKNQVNIPVDVVIQPKKMRPGKMPLLIEAKSAGDFTNVNKRRKEEATKVRQLRESYGKGVKYVLFLCGYFDAGYLGYEAAEGIDWVWEHRIDDMRQLGIE